MKRYLVLAVLVVAVVVMTAGIAAAGVSGTKHDMRSVLNVQGTASFNAATAEVCVYCHTPHSASTVITTLLWNKADATTNPAYAAYSSGSLNGTIDTVIGAQTRICLSCHDGSNSIFNMINTPNNNNYATGVSAGAGNITGGGQITGTPQLTRDMSNDHPVSIEWPAGDTGIANPAPVATYPLFGTPTANKMECGTCHSVHDNTNVPFLRADNTASNMCIDCHTNK